MSKKHNRTCIICGKNYHFCPSCGSSDSSKPSWYFIFDGQNCHDIYEVCVAYRDKQIDVKEAYERLSKLDLTGLEEFVESTRLQIEEILNYKSLVKENDSVKVETTKSETVSKTNGVKNVKNKK